MDSFDFAYSNTNRRICRLGKEICRSSTVIDYFLGAKVLTAFIAECGY